MNNKMVARQLVKLAKSVISDEFGLSEDEWEDLRKKAERAIKRIPGVAKVEWMDDSSLRAVPRNNADADDIQTKMYKIFDKKPFVDFVEIDESWIDEDGAPSIVIVDMTGL
jgi:5-bromo-4-chloroindolyl phosphate hydrolysis protein